MPSFSTECGSTSPPPAGEPIGEGGGGAVPILRGALGWWPAVPDEDGRSEGPAAGKDGGGGRGNGFLKLSAILRRYALRFPLKTPFYQPIFIHLRDDRPREESESHRGVIAFRKGNCRVECAERESLREKERERELIALLLMLFFVVFMKRLFRHYLTEPVDPGRRCEADRVEADGWRRLESASNAVR